MNYTNYFDKYAVIKSKKISGKLVSDFKQQAENLARNFDMNGKNLEGQIALLKGDARKIQEGICINKEAPFACGSIDCFFCKNCIPMINRENREYMDYLVNKYYDEILKEIKVVQELMRNFIKLITRDSVELNNKKITGNKKYLQEYQTQNEKYPRFCF